MKFLQGILIITIALITVVNVGMAQSTEKTDQLAKKSTKKRKSAKKRKTKHSETQTDEELGHSYGLQSYPGKTTYPVNTQALPTTYTSHMGNDW